MKPRIEVPTRFAGARVKRIEDPHLLVGRGTIVDDLTPSGCWHVVLVRSPHAHARINRIRSTSKSVVTARHLGRSVYVPGEAEEKEFARHPVLARDLVHMWASPSRPSMHSPSPEPVTSPLASRWTTIRCPRWWIPKRRRLARASS